MIDLPSNTIWLDDGRLGVAIVQGDEQWASEFPDATVEFVAPQAWAQYDKPCPCNCHEAASPDVQAECPLTNADCRDGRQVWTVRWPCPHSYVDRWGKRHDALHADGYRSAQATIQVVPVVASDDLPDDWESRWIIEVNPYGEVWLHRPDFNPLYHSKGLLLDPLPTPGRDFALIVRLV